MSPLLLHGTNNTCESQLQFGHIMRTPMAPNNCHLYGMVSYLAPRAKNSCLVRVIVDFPHEHTITIPIVSNVWNYFPLLLLQGNAQLRFAFMSLKLDETSRVLTNFLTPVDNCHCLSVQTGTATRPAYFTESGNIAMDLEPVLDNSEKPYMSQKAYLWSPRDR